EVLQGAGRRAQHRQAQFLAEQAAAAIDIRHVAQHPWPEAQRVERQPVARQRRLALRAADQVVPVVAIEVLPRDLDEFVKVLEAELKDLVRHRRGDLFGGTGRHPSEAPAARQWALIGSYSANLRFPCGSGYDAAGT